MVLVVNDVGFQAEILDFKGVSFVDFWATWCGPCRIQGPIIDSLAEKYSSETSLKLAKLDVDENNETAMQYKVLSIPTIIIFKDGKVMESLVGLRSETDLEEKIKYYLKG